MSFRLPTIESKNRLPEEDDYNFVNREKGKKPPLPKEAPGLQLIEELKRKVEEQKREIDTRNNTIMAIQRNFESMSVLLKNEKLEAVGIREENDRIKKQLEEVAGRSSEYYEKSLSLANEVKRLKDELQANETDKRNSKKQQESADVLKKIIADLEANVVNLSSRLIEADNEKKAAQNEVSKLKTIEKERRQLNERLVDLEEELHKKTEKLNQWQLEGKRNEDEMKLLREELHRKEALVEEWKKKEKEGKSKESSKLDELRVLRQQLADREASESQLRQLLESKDVVIAVKAKSEEEHKQQYNDLKHKEEQLRRALVGRQKELKETSELLANSLRNIEDKDQLLIRNQSESAAMKNSMADLEAKLRQTQQELLKAESNNQFLNDRTVSAGEKMDSLANDLAALRKERQELQQTINGLEQQLSNLKHVIKRYQQYDLFITEIDRHGGHVKVLSAVEHDDLLRKIEVYRKEEENLQRIILEEKMRLQAESNERRSAQQRLQAYQKEEAQLRSIIDAEKQQMLKLSSEKELKEQEVEKERTNNRLLWSDNKKLKEKEQLLSQLELQHQELQRRKSEELRELELKKERQLEKRTAEMKERYEAQMSDLKRTLSTNGELSSILLQKSNHIGKLQQELTKVTAELEFYRNRNKELEGVVGRTEKRFKEAEQTYIEDNEKEAKTHGQMITALSDKIAALEKDRKQGDHLLEMNKKLNGDIDRLQQHIASLQQKLSTVNFDELDRQRKENDQKLQAIRKSIEDLGESLTACTNNLNCNHCGELPVDSVKLIPCGHVYCKKCRAGYDPNCGECKVAGQPHPDRVNDQTIKKFRFMQTILTMLRENTKVLS